MIAYVYDKYSFQIENKIKNIISAYEGSISGDNTISILGNGSDYIVLESDTINLNNGDIIDISNLEDCRDYFILGKDKWQENKIKKLEEQNNKLQDNNAVILFSLMNGGLL